MPLTEADQNRLIMENIDVARTIAAVYRGRRGIPFEDLASEGVVGLVWAARNWKQSGTFLAYAEKCIHGTILKFIDGWQEFESLNELTEDHENRIHEWQMWGILPSEGWDYLLATPEEIMECWDSFKDRTASVDAALKSLSPIERKMVSARFLQEPRKKLEQVARDNRKSYFNTVSIVNRAVKKMRKIAQTYERRRPDPTNAITALAQQASTFSRRAAHRRP